MLSDTDNRRYTVVIRFMERWTLQSESVLDQFQDLMAAYDAQVPDVVWQRTFETIQSYLLHKRKQVLDEIVAIRDHAPLGPEDVEKYNPPGETMMKLNGICGFYGVHRVVIHLYLQAYLEAQDGNEVARKVLTSLDLLVEELYRP